MRKKAEAAEKAGVSGSEVWELSDNFSKALKDKSAIKETSNLLKGFTGMIKEATGLGNVFQDIQQDMNMFFRNLGGSMTEELSIGLGDLSQILEPLFDGIGRGLGTAISRINDALGPLMDWLQTPLVPEGILPNPNAATTPMDAAIQGGLSMLLGFPVGLANLFFHLFSPGGGFFG